MAKKVLIFDLGGVLVVNKMFDELPKLTAGQLSIDLLRDQWLESPAVRAFELGTTSPEQFAQSMVGEFQLTVTPAEFLSAFATWPSGFYPGAEELLAELRAQHQTACLSNSNVLHWTDKVTAPFDYAYSSHLLQRIKPDQDVFDQVTADIGCKPNEVVFFDDSRLNVEAAQAYGWFAHLTVGYAELLLALKELGVLKTI